MATLHRNVTRGLGWRLGVAVVGALLTWQMGANAGVPDSPMPAAVSPDASGVQAGAMRKVVFVAGVRSHAYGSHDHWAGSLLLSQWLREGHPQIETVVHRNGWPADPNAFDGASAVVIYSDGGANHPAVGHLDTLGALMNKGVGLVLLHYGVEVEEETAGQQFLDWTGGYFKIHWSVNPHWLLQVTSLPEHPITRGVKPFQTHDEWYYHMQFREGMKGVTPILTALPPASSLSRPDGTHSGNPHARAAVLDRREPQHMAWATERADGGRGFGFTGGHWHWNWGHPMQRKLVLNAIAWAAHADVPAGGIETRRVTIEDLEANPEEDVPTSWLATDGPIGDASTQTRTRAQLVQRLVEWHRDYPPAR